jgi:hypothetical protein
MVLNICFAFMMLIASLVEFGIAKRQIWQKHNAQSANFYMASLRVTAYPYETTSGCSGRLFESTATL